MSDADDTGNVLAIATASSHDDGDDVTAAILAAQHHIDLLAHASDVSKSNPHPASFSGESPNKKRDFQLGKQLICETDRIWMLNHPIMMRLTFSAGSSYTVSFPTACIAPWHVSRTFSSGSMPQGSPCRPHWPSYRLL